MTAQVKKIAESWDKTQQGLAMEQEGRLLWIEGTLELGKALAEARKQFPSHIKFSDWLTKEGYGENRINRHDRIALIGMSKNLTIARKVLHQTHRRSWEQIWIKEIQTRLPGARQTPQKSHNISQPEYEDPDPLYTDFINGGPETPKDPPQGFWLSEMGSGRITKEDDRIIMKALHPDHVTALGPKIVELHTKAMQIYNKYRDTIVEQGE